MPQATWSSKMTSVRASRRVVGAGIEVEQVRLQVNRYFESLGYAGGDFYYFRKNTALPLRPLALSPKKLAGVLRDLLVRRTVFIHLRAKGVQVRVKHHIRVYHEDRDGRRLSAKIAARSPNRGKNFAREIHARRLFPMLAPAIIDYDRKSLDWFVESELEIDGRADNRVKYDHFLQHCARDFYRPLARSRPMIRVLGRAGLDSGDVAAVLELYPECPAIDLERARVTCAMVHGDLSPVNMLVTADGRFYLLDFEHMGPGMIALDLARATNSTNVRQTLDIIHDCSGNDVIPAIEQLWVAAAIRLARLWKATGGPADRPAPRTGLPPHFDPDRRERAERKIRALFDVLVAEGAVKSKDPTATGSRSARAGSARQVTRTPGSLES